MDLFDLTAAILAGNMLTAMFVYGAIQFTKREQRGEWSWAYWGMIAFPIGVVLLAMFATGQVPPFLDAIAAR